MHPGAINPRPEVSLVSFNAFSVLLEECLFALSLSPLSSSYWKRSRRHLCHSANLRVSTVTMSGAVSSFRSPAAVFSSSSEVISSVSVSEDLGFEDPITLLYTINETYPATCMIDSGASSQFINHDFAMKLNLKLDRKKKPKALVLANGVHSKVGQIMHTCTLKLMINQHLENFTFHITKLAGWNLIVGKL